MNAMQMRIVANLEPAIRTQRASMPVMNMASIAQSAQLLDTRDYEEKSAAEIIQDLCPRTLAILDNAIAAVEDVAQRLDADQPPPATDLGGDPSVPEFGLSVDNLVSDLGERAQASDLAFIARLQLVSKRKRVGSATEDDQCWNTLEQCEIALRTVIESTGALEQTLSAIGGRPPEIQWYKTELDGALGIRRKYAALLRTVNPQSEVTQENVLVRLRLVGTRFAMVVGSSVYRDLRFSDRRAIRLLQTRVIEWLRGSSPKDLRLGVRLWQDIIGLGAMLAQINHRPALREHDASLLRTVLATPEANLLSGGPLPSSTIDALEPLCHRESSLQPHLRSDGLGDAGTQILEDLWRNLCPDEEFPLHRPKTIP